MSTACERPQGGGELFSSGHMWAWGGVKTLDFLVDIIFRWPIVSCVYCYKFGAASIHYIKCCFVCFSWTGKL